MEFQNVYSYFLLFFLSSTALAQINESRIDIVGDHPSISFISASQTKDVYGIAYFDCHVKNPGTNTVMWIKLKNRLSVIPGDQNDRVIAHGRNVVLETNDEGRINVSSNDARTSNTLRVKNLRPSDTGTYRCQLTNNIGATTELFVRSPPVFYEEETSAKGPVVLFEGASRTLTCNAHGYPTPDILWSRDEKFTNESVLAYGNVFNVRFANRKNTRGRYYCLARNSLGEVKKSIDVEVAYAPRLDIPKPIFGVTLHHDAYLECLSNAYPAANVTWFKGGQVIKNDDHYRITTERGQENNFINATLHIRSPKKEHFGVYLCRVENEIGYAAERISVLQNAIPDFARPIGSDVKSEVFEIRAKAVLNSTTSPSTSTPNIPTPTPTNVTVEIPQKPSSQFIAIDDIVFTTTESSDTTGRPLPSQNI